jgi:tetratricopeptide (TPR) repeat protein
MDDAMTGWRVIVAACALFAIQSTNSPYAWADQMDKRLDDLLPRLADTSNADEADSIENQVWAIWMAHPDEHAQRYMLAGVRQMNEGQVREAFVTFTRLIEMEPTFAEAWNKRATVNYMLHDYDASARDIAETLKLEPRHFGALSGLGLVNIALGRLPAALAAFEMALARDPHLRGVQENIKNLKEALKENEVPI